MNLNNLSHVTDATTSASPSASDRSMKQPCLSSYSQSQPPHLPPSVTTAAMLDSTRHFANSLRLLSNDEAALTAPTIHDSTTFLMPTTAAAVKEEPEAEAMTHFSEAQSPSEMSIPVDKVYPLVISDYYTNPVLFSQDMKEKVTAQCRRCGRPVTGWWAPRLVTSNFITHLKSCSMQLYNHFLDTKKRCGWAARRYTVKLHANSSSPGPAWNFSGNQSMSGASTLTEQHTAAKTDERPVLALLPAQEKIDQPSLKSNQAALRALLTFAAQEVRPPGSLCTGSVRRLLSSVNESIDFPTETEIRQFLSRHQPSIQSLAFSQLSPLDRSVVLLSLHGQLHPSALASRACTLVAFWTCFIAGGSLHKRLFSLRRFPDVDTALAHSLSHLDACRDRHNRKLALGPDSLLVLSQDPATYLRLPLAAGRPSPAETPPDIVALAKRVDTRARLLPDFCRRLWEIFVAAVRQVERLPLLLKAATAAVPARPEAAAPLVAQHLRLLGAAVEAMGNSYSAPPEAREDAAVLEATLNAGQWFEAAIQRLHRPGVSAGSRLPLLLGLQKKCLGEGGGVGMEGQLRAALAAGLEAAMKEEVSDAPNGDPSFSLLATFADPQYKLFWVEDGEQEARYRERIVKHLTARQPKVDESHDSAAAPSSASTSSSPSSSADFVQEGGDGLLDFVTKRRRLAISSAGCDWPIMDEVQTYLGNHEEAGPLDFWANVRHQENYPNVYKLHLEVHAVPVSCLDTSLALGLSNDLLTRVACDREWIGESDDVAQSLVLSKALGYDFSN